MAMTHTDALMALVGLELPVGTALATIGALREATLLRAGEVGRHVVRVTLEDARLLQRAALAEELNATGVFSLARAVMRREASDAALLVVSVGEDAPSFRTVPMRLLRAVFANGKRRAP
jgi:hypothetical protein